MRRLSTEFSTFFVDNYFRQGGAAMAIKETISNAAPALDALIGIYR
jgi:hypothetical protein